MKTINRVYLKNELLNKKGEIRRENLDKEPCKYEFFRVEYSDKFMVQEEIKMMIIT